ncbi:MAG: TolC family protein [Chitinispirillaceae bacterium]|nr:TolC family protein [Chitinispirillaceae bacterium]
MKTAYRIACIVTVLHLLGLFPLHAEETLDRYLAEAALNNPGLKSSFNEYMAALEKVPQAGALPDPQLTFGYFVSPVETRVGPQRARVSASQMFPWFGSLKAKKEASVLFAKSKYEVFEEAKSRLFYEVKSAYYTLYYAQKAIAITGENIDILKTFRRLALLKVESGMASAVDVFRVEMEIADTENQLALQKDGFFALQSGFNNLLHTDEERAVALPDTLTTSEQPVFDRKAVLDSIRNGNHQILRAAFMEASYKKQVVAARKAGMPTIMLGFDYVVVGKSMNPMTAPSESGRDAFVFPMIGLSIPLYRHTYSSMVKEAVFMQKSTEEAGRDKVNVLETAFANAEKEYKDAQRRLPLFNGQAARAQNALNILRTEYESSGKNFEEVLRMERMLLEYKLQTEKARSDIGVTIASIRYLTGK